MRAAAELSWCFEHDVVVPLFFPVTKYQWKWSPNTFVATKFSATLSMYNLPVLASALLKGTLDPQVGPSTFFSSKQFEVFDVELVSIRDCQRRTIGFYSDVVCNWEDGVIGAEIYILCIKELILSANFGTLSLSLSLLVLSFRWQVILLLMITKVV